MLGVHEIQSFTCIYTVFEKGTYEIYSKILAGVTGRQSQSKAVGIREMPCFTEKHSDRTDRVFPDAPHPSSWSEAFPKSQTNLNL